jgi:predicted permease
MNRLFQDIHYALRQLRKNPSFACTAILILGLGIGASVAIFAFVDAALIKPLPYSNPTRLVEVTESAPMIPRANLSYLDFLDWTSLNQVFRSMDVYTGSDSMMSVPTGVEPVTGTRVSDGFFRTLGITPVLGRDFYAGEDLPSAPHTVIVTYAAWQKRFGGRKNVIGQIVTLDGVAHTIIGVLPRNFQFAPVGDSQFWTTLHASGFCELRRACHNLNGIGRLKDGVSVETALANMQSVAQQLARQYPDTNRDQSARVVPLSEVIIGDIRPILLVLLGGAGLLFLIACVNVSSLLLVRAESRTRETAVRGALGASRARLARQFITEGLVLTVVGSLFGLWFGYEATRVILRLISTEIVSMPYLNGLGLNLHVMAFAAGISLLAAMLFSITPIARTRLTNMRAALAEGSRGVSGTAWRRLGSNLVIVELAIAMVLLVGAGLLGKSLYRLLHVDLGFQPDHLATLRVMAPSASYGNGKEAQAVALGRQITDRIASLPGVKSAGISSLLPVTYNGNTEWIRIVGRPYHGEHNEVNERDVSSGYFTTLQAKLLRGRYFTDAEDASKPHVVIVNQALAKQYFPGEDPIGKRIGDNDLSPDSINEIVGVVADIREGGLDSDIWPAAYYPFNQLPDSEFSLIVRTSLPEQSLLPTLSAAIRQINPNLATNFEASMNQRINDSQSAYLHRSSAWLVGGFAGLALLLGVVGLYGVIAYSVSQRTREIGVRMALGAQRRSVYQLILKEAGWLIAGGLIIGVFCSLAAAALMRNLLFGTNSWDVTTLAAVAAVLAVSALLASYIPARRAAKVDPMEALRYE